MFAGLLMVVYRYHTGRDCHMLSTVVYGDGPTCRATMSCVLVRSASMHSTWREMRCASIPTTTLEWRPQVRDKSSIPCYCSPCHCSELQAPLSLLHCPPPSVHYMTSLPACLPAFMPACEPACQPLPTCSSAPIKLASVAVDCPCSKTWGVDRQTGR